MSEYKSLNEGKWNQKSDPWDTLEVGFCSATYNFRIPLDESWINLDNNVPHDAFVTRFTINLHSELCEEPLRFQIMTMNLKNGHFSPRYEWVDFVTGERYHIRGSWDW